MGRRVAVVAGSSRGIGLAVARSLAAEGWAVVVNGREPDAAAAAAAGITAAGGTAVAVAGSAAEPGVADAMVAAAGALGPIEALVNCAGTAEPPGSSILDVTLEEWQALIDAHLTSTFVTCRAIAPLLAARGRGAVVNTSSHAFTGVYGGTGYPAAKGAVNSLTTALAAELAEHGVRVNAVCPGARTRLSTGAEYERHLAELRRRGLLDELTYTASLDPGSPEHAAALYVYLAGDRSAGVTGRVFAAAGGYVGRFPVPEAELLAWRDHATNPPWTQDELAAHLDPPGGPA
jgi:3-oxoacyl-[acyl-carrier protein] reductase